MTKNRTLLFGLLILGSSLLGCSGEGEGPRKALEGDYSGPPGGPAAGAQSTGGSPAPARPPSGN